MTDHLGILLAILILIRFKYLKNLKKKRILFVTPVIPIPINRGSAHRTDQMIRALLDNGFRVKLLVLNQSEEKTTSTDLKNRLEKHYSTANLVVDVRRHPNYSKKKKWTSKIEAIERVFDKLFYRDALINNRSALPGNFEKLIRKEFETGSYDYAWFNYMKVKPSGLNNKNTRIVIDMHDMQSARIKLDVLPEIGSMRQKKYFSTFFNSEKKELQNCDIAISISPVETEAIKMTYKPLASLVTLKATDDIRRNLDSRYKFDIAFIGSNSAPNADGLVWFIQEVLPLVVEENPRVKFLIQGNVNRNKAVKEAIANSICKSAVTQQGFVESLESIYRESRIIICPIRYGTGMKIKVVEAMAYGKAIVGTPAAFEGIDYPSCDIAEINPHEFSLKISECIKNEAIFRKRIEISKKCFDESHSYSSLVKNISSVFL